MHGSDISYSSQLCVDSTQGQTCPDTALTMLRTTVTCFLLISHVSTNTRVSRDSSSNVPSDLVTGRTK